MSKDYHAAALKSKRETALETVPKILDEIERYGNSGHENARKFQLMYTSNILTGICQSCEALQNAAHYDIYVDITTRVLLPRLEPKASIKHWKRLLSSLEYLFSRMVEHSVHNNDAHRLYSYIVDIQQSWTDEDDSKYLLSVHGYNLQLLAKLQQNISKSSDSSSIKNNVLLTFKALKKLFVNVNAQNKEKPMDCNMLLNQFITKIVNRNRSIQMLLSTTWQCKELECMFEAFLDLLKANSRFISKSIEEDQSEKFRDNIQALCNFLQMDINSKLKLNFALQFARILPNLKIFKANENIKHCSVLLYNMLKLIYEGSTTITTTVHIFKENYSILCTKFSKYLAQSGELLMQQLWFQDVVVFVFYLFCSIQMTASNDFDTFWQQMDNDLCVLSIKLITELVKITPLLTKINFLKFACCKNQNSWYHIQLNFTQISLEIYTQMMKNCNVDVVQSHEEALREISVLLEKSINTMILMENDCQRSTISIRKFCISFTKLLQESNRCENAPHLMPLATDMARLKSRISSEDWLMIMSRVNKNVSKCKDAELAANILSCYIADLISSPAHCDFLTLHQLFYYHHYGQPGTSLFEIYLNLSKSPFKSLLQRNERRYYHWFEAQYINKMYEKEKNCAIFTIIAQRSVSRYDFINAVRSGGLINEPTMFSKVQNIYEVLNNKKREANALTRWEELILAHTMVLLLTKSFETQQTTAKSSKDFYEINFLQLLNDKSFTSLSVTNEFKMINMARDALKSFEVFFDKADEEPLTSHDSNFLDWEHILEDITQLALYLQMTGYLIYAYDAWQLQYRIANMIDDVQSSLRSLAFFCEYSYLIEYKDDRSMKLSNEIESKLIVVPHILDNLMQLSRRQQNFTLTCICQIAYFYALNRQSKKSENLLNLVKDLHKNKLQRKEEDYDIILFTADIVEFRIERMREDLILLKKIEAIIERLYSYTNVSSADVKPYIILFLNAIDEFADFSTVRLFDNFLNSFFSSTMKICVERGYVARTVHMLSKWALINLQMEHLERADVKMQFIECILNLKDFKEIAASVQSVNSCATEASKEHQIDVGSDMNLIGPEEVRKVASLKTPPPFQMCKNNNNNNNNNGHKATMALDFKLEKCQYHDENTKEMDHVVLWCRFTLNCLRARFLFLSFQFTNLDIFYKCCEKWLEKRRHTIHFQINQSTVLTCMMHYGNFLRANKQYERAIVCLEKCIDHCVTFQDRLDPAHLKNFVVQLEDTKLEKIEIKNRNLPIKMKSHISNLSSLNTNKKTPVTKSIKYKTIAVTSYKKPSSSSSSSSTLALSSTQKCLDFAIYSDAESSSPSEPTGSMKKLAFKGSSSESISSGSEKENLDQLIVLSDSDYEFDNAADKDKDKPKSDWESIATTKKKFNKSKKELQASGKSNNLASNLKPSSKTGPVAQRTPLRSQKSAVIMVEKSSPDELPPSIHIKTRSMRTRSATRTKTQEKSASENKTLLPSRRLQRN